MLSSITSLATMGTLLLAGGTSNAASGAASRAGRQCATPGFVAGHVTCLRVGQRCKSKYRKAYLEAGFVCRKVGRKRQKKYSLSAAGYAQRRGGEVLDLQPSGRPTFKQALWYFDHNVAPLPGVKTPKGAIGRDGSAGGAIRSLDLYRKRLTKAQRRVLDRALNSGRRVATVDPDGNRVDGATARAAAGPSDMPAVLAEAVQRLRAHGVRFKHPLSYAEYAHNDAAGDLADTLGEWLYHRGNDCSVTFYPDGYNESLTDRRVTMIHELMHCAMFEASANRQVADAQPKFLDEGLPEWAAYRVGIEWQNSIGEYLAEPWRSLYGRSYSAAGWWALAEHEGIDPFTLQPKLVVIGGTGNADAVAASVRNAAVGIDDDWGPTLATTPTLGRRWDIGGPGERPRNEPDKGTLSEDSNIEAHAEKAGGEEFRSNLQAEIVVATGPQGGQGLIRDADGNELAMTGGETRYCTVDEGCECPDGTKLDYPNIAPGDAHVGFAATDGYSSVGLKGMSIDEACNVPKATRRLDLKTGVVGGVKIGMARGPISHRRTVTSLLGRPQGNIIEEAGIYLATYGNGELGIYFRPRSPGVRGDRDKVVGVLTFSKRYTGTLSIGDQFPAPDAHCAPADRRSAPGGGPRRVSACIYSPGAARVRDIIYMALNTQSRAGQRISGIGIFDSGVATALFSSLVQGALDDLGCSNRACT
jgi:hypothetical protein